MSAAAELQSLPSRVPSSMFEGLFVRALQPEGRFLEELRQAGCDPAALQASYAPEVFLACIHVARKHVCPELPQMEGERELGRRFADGFLNTIVGRVLAAGLPMVGPERMVKRLPRIAAMGRTDVEISTVQLSPREWRVTVVNPTAMPCFMAGCAERILTKTCATGRVRVAGTGPRGFELLVDW